MRLRALHFTPFLLVGCASPRMSPVIVGDTTGARASASSTEAPPVEAPAAHAASTEFLTLPAPDPEVPSGSTLARLSTVTPQQPQQQPPGYPPAQTYPQQQSYPPPPPSARRPPPPRYLQRFTLKGGYYGSSEDEFDDGYIINASWMRFTSEVFATEFEIGYLDASGSDNGVDRDVWSIPLILNGRFNVPVGRIEVYGGLGFGSFYYEAVAKTPGVKVSADGFLFGGDAFFGGCLNLGQGLSLGLEGKYYVTDNVSDLGGGLDAYVVMLTLGFGR